MSRQWVSCIGYQRRYLGLMEILMLMCLPSKEWHDPAKAANTAIREHHISHFLHSENGTIREVQSTNRFSRIFTEYSAPRAAQGFINRELDKLLKVCFTTNCLQQQQMMEESWGLILHRIEIFILNVKPRLRLSLFWTVVGSFHPHQNFNFKFWN